MYAKPVEIFEKMTEIGPPRPMFNTPLKVAQIDK